MRVKSTAASRFNCRRQRRARDGCATVRRAGPRWLRTTPRTCRSSAGGRRARPARSRSDRAAPDGQARPGCRPPGLRARLGTWRTARRCRCSTSSWPARAGLVGRRGTASPRRAAGSATPVMASAGGGDGSWQRAARDLDDPVTGLRAEVFYRILAGGSGALRSWVRLENRGARAGDGRVGDLVPVRRPAGPAAGPDDLADLDLLWAENDWLAEGRWQRPAAPRRPARPEPAACIGADPRGWFGADQRRHLVVGHVPADGRGREPADRPRVGLADRAQRRLALAGRRVHAPRAAEPGPHGRHAPGRGQRRLPRPPRPDGRRAPLAGHARRQARRSPPCRSASRSARTGSTAPWPGSPPYRRAIRRPHEDHRRLPGDLQRLHEHADGRPDHRAAAAADRRGRRGRAPSTSASTPAGTRRSARAGGTRSARGGPRVTRFPGGHRRGARPHHGPRGWCPACGWSPRWSGVNSPVARAASGGGVLPARRPARRRERPLPPGPAPSRRGEAPGRGGGLPGRRPGRRLPQAGLQHQRRARDRHRRPERGRRPAGGEPRAARLAGRGARPPSRAGHRELLVRRHADRLRAAVPAPAAVHQRPAGLPPLPADRGGGARRDRPPSRPPSGPTRSPSSATTRSRSRCAARCSAGSTCPATSTG